MAKREQIEMHLGPILELILALRGCRIFWSRLCRSLCRFLRRKWPKSSDQPGRLLHYCVWFGFLVITLAGQGQTSSPPQTPKFLPTKEASESTSVELRGRVVCLPEEMHQLHQADLPTGHEHIYGFGTSDGKYYTILRTKYSEALFADERFRQKELLLKGRIFSQTQIFEPMTIRSIKDGTVQDIFYYCSVCDIETVAPGPCECCQGPTELVEKPLPKKP